MNKSQYVKQLENRLSNIESLLLPHIDPTLQKNILQRRERSTVGQVRDIAVLFTDIRQFTNFSHKINLAPLSSFLNNYYDIVIHHTRSHGGVVDKLMGDGSMSLFGALDDNPEYIHNSAAAARGILADFRSMILESHEPNVGLGVGIAAGPTIVGTFGNGELISFTALGTTVNLAARIEALSSGRDILCNSVVAKELNEDEVKFKGWHELKGFAKKKRVYYIR